MLAELLSREHRGRIVSAVCVRYQSDLAYLRAHRELERQPGGMIDVLHKRGFVSDRPKQPGNVHFERYW